MLAGERVLAAAGRRLHRQLVDVGAGDERLLAGAGQDHDAHALVLLQLEDRAAQLVERLRVQRVEHLGTVDRDDRDGAVALEEEVVERHGDDLTAGNGYISQPSTTADARKPPNISPPKRICSRASSFAMTAKTSDTKNANMDEQQEVALHHFRPIATS